MFQMAEKLTDNSFLIGLNSLSDPTDPTEAPEMLSTLIKWIVTGPVIAIETRLGTPLAGGLRSQKGLRPFNPLQRISN